MDRRSALDTLAAQHNLDADQRRQLFDLAGLTQPPPQLGTIVLKGTALLGAILCGLGLVFWVAANWDGMARSHKFILLEVLFGAACLGALLRAGARVPLALTAFLAMGGLFALFGQTYQTGADPWQLFALWAALGLPLCLSVRHDALWSAWVLVAMTALTLWGQAAGGSFWNAQSASIDVRLAAWAGAAALAVAMALPLRRFSGAGDWAFRLAVLMSTLIIGVDGVMFLIGRDYIAIGALALLVLGIAFYALTRERLFDIVALCTLALAIDILFIIGLARVIDSTVNRKMDWGTMLIIAAGAAAAFGLTAKLILDLWRNHGRKEPV